ncbi:MAG: hypothetical protein JXR25_10525 [Pontiellaceae bacterium]|nr:hypothetical protein [Pontiellaceae bacterium]MBN2785254.1 hypothetical protein [Pontiellaceae bacterium]
MNSPRVNLLKKSEQRYQGAVSRRFIMVSAVVTPILLIAVLSGIKLVQFTGVQSDLRAKKELWAEMQPRLEVYKEENRSLAANRSILELFEGWEASQISIVEIMEDIQDIVPVNMQFTRLVVRGNVAPGTYANAEEMGVDFKLQVDGLALGDRAEEDVWRFHKEMLSTESIASVFDFIDLSDMRKRLSNDGSSSREFSIIGSNKEGAE